MSARYRIDEQAGGWRVRERTPAGGWRLLFIIRRLEAVAELLRSAGADPADAVVTSAGPWLTLPEKLAAEQAQARRRGTRRSHS